MFHATLWLIMWSKPLGQKGIQAKRHDKNGAKVVKNVVTLTQILRRINKERPIGV